MKKIIHLLPILLILPLVILGLLDLLKNSSNRLQAADGDTITVTINPAVIKNNDFAQLLGGYISTRANLNPTSKFLLSQPSVVDAAKKMFPQPPEFPNPVVLRTQSFHMLSNDYFVITDAEVEDVIKFCSQANCDPMFGALGEGVIETHDNMTGKIIDTSAAAIKKRAEFVKAKCQQYFGDDKHCLHWDIGNEPPSPDQNCYFYATDLIPTAIRTIKQVIPNAIFHAPELYLDSAKARYWDDVQKIWIYRETIGECIAKELQKFAPDLKIDIFTTHWYPYNCSATDTALNVDGNAVLNWGGFGYYGQNMTYPFSITGGMSTWIKNYSTTQNALIGVGELNPMAACSRYEIPVEKQTAARITETVNATWGGAFWHLDILGIMAEAGIKYVQKHIHIGSVGTYETMVISGSTLIKVTPYYAYRFYSQYFGKTIVDSNSSNPSVVNSHASIDKDGNLRVILINKSGSGFKPGTTPNSAVAKKIRINILNYSAGSIGEVYKMTSPGDFLQGTITDENTFYKIETNVLVGNSFEYTVAPYTAAIIKIPTLGGIPPPSDTQPPSTPTNLSATAISSSQINLSWSASTDNVGVTGYRIYRCAGTGCVPSIQIATSADTSYSDTGLAANTIYVYRVAAYDAAGNVSGQSSSASATTQSPPPVQCSLANSQEAGENNYGLDNTWSHYATFNAAYTGYIEKIYVKAGNYGGTWRNLFCKITNSSGTQDISGEFDSEAFRSDISTAWLEILFDSSKTYLTIGTNYRLYCRGPDTWYSLYWVFNSLINNGTYRIYLCPGLPLDTTPPAAPTGVMVQ